MLERWTFHERIASPRTPLMVANGQQRRSANLLPEVGVVKLPAESS